MTENLETGLSTLLIWAGPASGVDLANGQASPNATVQGRGGIEPSPSLHGNTPGRARSSLAGLGNLVSVDGWQY